MEYEIEVSIRRKIIAEDEEEALNKFWELINEEMERTNTDFQHFLDLNTKITPLQSDKKMETQKKYTLYIGLKDKNNKVLDKAKVIKVVNEELNKVGIIGFTLMETIEYWKGKKEPLLIVTFVNIFDVSDTLITALTRRFVKEFNQECILLEKSLIEYDIIEKELK